MGVTWVVNLSSSSRLTQACSLDGGRIPTELEVWKTLKPRLRTGLVSLILCSISQSKSWGQPGFKDWENGLHLLMGRAAKSRAQWRMADMENYGHICNQSTQMDGLYLWDGWPRLWVWHVTWNPSHRCVEWVDPWRNQSIALSTLELCLYVSNYRTKGFPAFTILPRISYLSTFVNASCVLQKERPENQASPHPAPTEVSFWNKVWTN